ncbi:hypothetical protein [Azospirillum sp. TSO22-1]|uniref:hypothetical protein n=1 Tax=Azospirillum sp. TSO22-1 TaxID=716789 RepID=UPI000D62153D|nr:hypothetical protein [Azospirillum sp. TSO22-1]PWC43508.1 hypothetical protein TSO221_19295 [Azospirillum sp. TSO22-1]
MTEAPTTDDRARCPRCDLTYPADEPGCPRCRRIRQSNILIATTMVMLVILALVGWLGMQVLFM